MTGPNTLWKRGPTVFCRHSVDEEKLERVGVRSSCLGDLAFQNKRAEDVGNLTWGLRGTNKVKIYHSIGPEARRLISWVSIELHAFAKSTFLCTPQLVSCRLDVGRKRKEATKSTDTSYLSWYLHGCPQI